MSISPNTQPQSRLVHYLRVIPQVTLLFVDRHTARAISLTCTYVQEFFRREPMQELFCALHFPLYTLPRDANNQLLCPCSESYARLTAAHSGKPGIVKSSTITCKGEMPGVKQLVTPDGKQVVTCNVDAFNGVGVMSLYEINTGELIWKKKASPDILQFSPDGKLFISDLRSISSVNLETGEITLIASDCFIDHMQISADGKYAYIRTRNKKIQYLNLSTGQLEDTYLTPETLVFAFFVSINREGTMALFQNFAGHLCYWKIQTGEISKIPKKFPWLNYNCCRILIDRMRAVFIEPDDLTSALNPLYISILDLNTGKEVRSIPISMATGVRGEILEVTPDVRHAILRCSNNDLLLIDLELGRHVGTINDPDDRIWSIQIKADGTGIIYKTSSATNRNDTCIKAFNFCALPKERIANLARVVCSRDFRRVMEEIQLLPRFVRTEILAIRSDDNNIEKSLDIYKAIRMDLHPIRRLLRQAQSEPHRAEELYSEAEQMLRALALSIQQDVWRHFADLQIKRGRSPNDALSNPRFAEIFKDGSLLEDGIEAITRTIAEYIAMVKGQPSTTSSKPERKEA